MRKSVICILLVVVMVCVSYYASAEIDLTTMSDSELKTLRDSINTELEVRRYERMAKDGRKNKGEIEAKFKELNWAFDFEAIVQLIDSGEGGLSGESESSIRELATEAAEKMSRVIMSSDDFTGELLVTSTMLKKFGDGCQVFPYINDSGFYAIMGFPNEDALFYDLIYIKDKDGDVTKCERFEKNGGYDIQFEYMNDRPWEYSILSDYSISTAFPVAISFREDGSVRSENYSMTTEEQTAFNDLYTIAKNQQEITSNLTHWYLYGE